MLRLVSLFAATVAARFVQLPAPNVEPVMSTLLPASKFLGKFASFAYAFSAIALFDILVGRAGLWTLYTGIAYGLVGLAATRFLRNANRWRYAGFAIIATLFYDAATALLFGWQFGQPLALTVFGQIPFTAYHVLSNAAFAFFLSPAIAGWLAGAQSAFSLRRPLSTIS